MLIFGYITAYLTQINKNLDIHKMFLSKIVKFMYHILLLFLLSPESETDPNSKYSLQIDLIKI